MDPELKHLSVNGLNIYACAQVSELPAELRAYLPEGYQSLHVFGHGGGALWSHLPHPLDSSTHPIDRYVLDQVHWFAKTALGEPHPRVLFPLTDDLIPLQRIGRAL